MHKEILVFHDLSIRRLSRVFHDIVHNIFTSLEIFKPIFNYIYIYIYVIIHDKFMYLLQMLLITN